MIPNKERILIDRADRRSDVASAIEALRSDSATSHIPILLVVPRTASRHEGAPGETADDRRAKPFLGSEHLIKVRELVGRHARPRPRHATEPENP